MYSPECVLVRVPVRYTVNIVCYCYLSQKLAATTLEHWAICSS